ncbi:hypothetical protein PG996_004886 [Apiospora saccharicola]|uniref:Uncharacterized protein n=1 Tax=Apiospora saccharicola TaxID=335842 RepID=A0ABR1VNV8_9PEZI
MSENTKPASSTPSGSKSRSLTRTLSKLVLRRKKSKLSVEEQETPSSEPLDNPIASSSSRASAPSFQTPVHPSRRRPSSQLTAPGIKPPSSTLREEQPPSSSLAPEKAVVSKPEDFFSLDSLVEALDAVDFCRENGGEIGERLAWMMRHWEDSGTIFSLGCLEDACYGLQPLEGACNADFMVLNPIYPQVWRHPSTIIRIQWCYYHDDDYDFANGFTCYQLGSIMMSKSQDPVGVLNNQGPQSVTSWTDSHCKLVVQLHEDAEDGAVSGHPTGPVWVVNYTGYDKAEMRRRASTRLEGVLVARVADSLPELLECRRAMWPKFEDMDADYVEFHPCYQEEEGGPIECKDVADGDCV